MPITLVTGVPGSGKTAMVVKLLMEARAKELDKAEKAAKAEGRVLSADERAKAVRPVYVDGIPELTLPHEVLDKAGENWHEPGIVPDGALIVIDEVQRYWRTRSSGSKVPPPVAALETHRHRGLDFIIVTQNEGLIDSNVRHLVGRHIHLRNIGVLGRRQYEWNECGDSARPKSAPIQLRYKLPKEVFGQYKSASIHVVQSRRVPPVLIAIVLGVLFCGGAAFMVYRSFAAKLAPQPVAAASPASGVRPSAGAPGAAVARPGQPSQWRPVTDEPYEGLGVHMAGCMGDVCMWALTIPHRQDRPAQYFTTRQLALAGYEVKVIAPCAALLTFGTIKRRVTCDQPAQVAGPARPGAPAAVQPAAAALPDVPPVSL